MTLDPFDAPDTMTGQMFAELLGILQRVTDKFMEDNPQLKGRPITSGT